MIVLHDGDPAVTHESAVAIGVFDGLHVGHQKIIARLGEIARRHKARATVVTFDPHPATVLAPERAPLLIGSLEQRLEGLELLGVDQVRILNFDEVLARESATSFIERVLVRDLSTRHVVVGEDFHFGHNREGNVDLLGEVGQRHHFEVHPAPIFGDGVRWSSTSVRESLQVGDLALANKILGRPFTMRATVAHGDARGRELGFPTANLRFSKRHLVPGIGIYAGAAKVGAQWWPGAVSVGTRPQFYDDGSVLVEVYIAGFGGDLYDSVLDVAFLEHLRGEMVFEGVNELVRQIERDVEQTVAIFAKFSPSTHVLLG
ncbi:MAG TPA: bifunctional riboflavin kinase/FAD synthetase [Acidimicrobiales bacterium]